MGGATVTTFKAQNPPGSGTWETLGSVGPPGANGVSVPVGGSVGQLLAKKSTTAFDAEWFTPPMCRVRRTNTMTLAVGFTNMQWETEDYDVGYGGTGCVDLVANNQRLYAPYPGLYQARVCVGVGYVASNRIAARVNYGVPGDVMAEKAMAVTLSHCCVDCEAVIYMTTGSSVYFPIYSQVASSVLNSSTYNYAELRWVAPF